MKKKKSMQDIVLDLVIYIVLSVLIVVTLYPVWHVLIASFSTTTSIAQNNGFLLWPGEFSLLGYQKIIENRLFMGGLRNSIVILLVSLPLNIFMTLLCSYFMASNGMIWKRPVSLAILFTMYFSGGLIPGYINIKELGLGNTMWSLILPGLIQVYNAIILKTAIEAVPDSLTDAAYIDGANDFQIIFKVLMPLLKPTLAVLVLYYGVAHWNAWLNASIYITDDTKLPVQNIIRMLLAANDEQLSGSGGDNYNSYAETIKYSAIVISTAPILCVYPFLQKYFAKGAMIGAVKG